MPTPSEPSFVYTIVIIALTLLITFFVIWLFQSKPWIRNDKQDLSGNLSETQKNQSNFEQLDEKISEITQVLIDNATILRIKRKGRKTESVFDDILEKLDFFEEKILNHSWQDSDRKSLDSIKADFQQIQEQIIEIRKVLPETVLFERTIENFNLLPIILKIIQELPSSEQTLVDLLKNNREFLETTLTNMENQIYELKSDVKLENSQNLSDDGLRLLCDRLQLSEQSLKNLVEEIEALKLNDQNAKSTAQIQQEIQSLAKKIQDLLDSQGYRPDFSCENCGNTVAPKNAIYCPSCGQAID